MRKKKVFKGGLAYSTDPDMETGDTGEDTPTLPPAEQQLHLQLDRRQRKGKTVTLIDGFVGSQQDLEALAKKLKAHCGTGGSAKDGYILIQGDVREKAKDYLHKNGYGARG